MKLKGRLLKNGIILTPFKKLFSRVLVLEKGLIKNILPEEIYHNSEKEYNEDYEIIDAKNNYISPGFIDIHTHGANNIDAAFGPYQPFADFKARHGTTGFLPTFWNLEFETLVTACKNLSRYISEENKSGAKILGINSEGPYINPDFGAQRKERAILPVYRDYRRLIESAGQNLKIMTASPEIDGYEELVKYLVKNNVTAAICYSRANSCQLKRAIELGLSHIDHIFDGFGEPVSPERGVKPYGIEDELLVCDELSAEVIADSNGVHVSSILLNILIRCKGVRNIVLITDSRDITGNPPGEYILGDGFKAIIKEGEDIVRLGNGDLAGCIMTMDRAVKNMINHTNVSILEAVVMSSYNPARVIKMSHRKGQIKEGMDADITIFDENINVKMTIVEGIKIYDNL